MNLLPATGFHPWANRLSQSENPGWFQLSDRWKPTLLRLSEEMRAKRLPRGERRRITMRCLTCGVNALPVRMELVRIIRAMHEDEHPGHKMLLEIWR